MLYTIAKIAGTEYKLRLGAQNCADVEKRLGKSVLDVLLAMAPTDMSADQNPDTIGLKGISTPCVGDICIIIWGAMQKYQHGISIGDVYDLYDRHIDDGGSYNDFIGWINNTLEVSGFLAREAAPEEQAPKCAGQPVA